MPRCKKIMFESEEEAKQGVATLRDQHGKKKFPRSIRFYQCPDCGAWHFTRMGEPISEWGRKYL